MDAAIDKPVGDDSVETRRPILLGGSTIGPQHHICGFFNTRDDLYRVLLPFIKEGFERGEKAVHIIDPRRREEHVQQLRSIGIDAAAKLRVGQLDLREWADAHLRDGFFDQYRTRAVIDDIRQRSTEEGFRVFGLSRTWSGRWKLDSVPTPCSSTKRVRTSCPARIRLFARTILPSLAVTSSSTSCEPIP